jgi:hypothetical protein
VRTIRSHCSGMSLSRSRLTRAFDFLRRSGRRSPRSAAARDPDCEVEQRPCCLGPVVEVGKDDGDCPLDIVVEGAGQFLRLGDPSPQVLARGVGSPRRSVLEAIIGALDSRCRSHRRRRLDGNDGGILSRPVAEAARSK